MAKKTIQPEKMISKKATTKTKKIDKSMVCIEEVEDELIENIEQASLFSQLESETEGHRLIELRKSKELTQAGFAEELGISQQIISRVESEIKSAFKKRDYEKATVPLSLKYKVLKKYGYDIETGKEIDFKRLDNTYSVPMTQLYIKNRIMECNHKETHVYCDKRWLANEIGVQAENAFIITLDYFLTDEYRDKLKTGDILLFDSSQKTPTKIPSLYAIEIRHEGLAIAEISEDWKTDDRTTTVIASKSLLRHNEIRKIKTRSTIPISQRSYEILGKAVWNGSQKFIWKQ